MPHPASASVDRAIGLLDPATFRRVNVALRDLLSDLYEDAVTEGASKTSSKIERVCSELGIDIKDGDERLDFRAQEVA